MSEPVPKNTLLNPFEISDDQIWEKVYITHLHSVETTYDVVSLYSAASNIINRSMEISEVIIKGDAGPHVDEIGKDTSPLASLPQFRALKRIACQMICTARGDHYAHQTTMKILEKLKAYSWDTKAVIALAAFALEYGRFWQLATIPRDQLGKSMAELNGVGSILENAQHLVYSNSVVKRAMKVIECITEWKKLTSISTGLNKKDVPPFSVTLQEIPVVVYWAIITFVACASHIDFMAVACASHVDFMGDKGYKSELSNFDCKLNLILENFKDLLDKCNTKIGEIDYSWRRDTVLKGIQTGNDIVLVLKALIVPCNDTQDSEPSVCNGLTEEKVGVEVFKKKYVLLFISGLDNIQDDIQLLRSIYEKLKEEPKNVVGYRKEDFKILWVPIVDEWSDKHKKILKRTKIGWYVVKQFNFSTGIRIIREVFNYKEYPIIPVISPEGKILNPDAKQILCVWGIDGFPFRTSDHIRLTHQWGLFWITEMTNITPRLEEFASIYTECNDVESLYSAASNIIKQSIRISETVKSGQQIEPSTEDAGPLTSLPLFRALKRIACQMICTARGEQYAHQTTILMLQQLKAYSWDAKAVIALAAFALEYGQFWHLATTPRDQLGKLLAELNGLQSIQENMQQLLHFGSLAMKAMEVIEYVTEWKKLTSSSSEHNVKDVLAMSDILQETPVIVYWAIVTFVACASNIDFTEEVEDYSGRRDVILKDIRTGKDIVLVLIALIIPCSGTQDAKPLVYNGLTGEKVGVEVFKNKHVLLFLSGLDNIEDEIHLLKSIYDRLKENAKEVDDYRKEDFNILWVPIVDDWNDKNKKIFENYLENTRIGWCVVKKFNFSIGIKVIREVFNYKDKSIIPVISPEGKIVSHDAKQILSVWGIDRLPHITQQWDWFWAEMIKLNPSLRELIKEDNYIFIYGGTNEKWFKDFGIAVEKFKRGVAATLEDTVIESYPFGKDDPKIVPRFWVGIDSLLASKKLKKGKEMMDSATTHIKRLIDLKQDRNGWVILSKGSNVKLMGRGKAMYRTISDFDIWKEKLHHEVSFGVAFKEYYESKFEDVPHKCAYIECANYPTDIRCHISCPDPECGREMEVASVTYKGSHGLENAWGSSRQFSQPS